MGRTYSLPGVARARHQLFVRGRLAAPSGRPELVLEVAGQRKCPFGIDVPPEARHAP
jgi:hypothetical protein